MKISAGCGSVATQILLICDLFVIPLMIQLKLSTFIQHGLSAKGKPKLDLISVLHNQLCFKGVPGMLVLFTMLFYCRDMFQ